MTEHRRGSAVFKRHCPESLMIVRPIAALMGAGLALASCQQPPDNPSAPTPTPTATVTVAVPALSGTAGTPTPVHSKGIATAPDPEPCGADKLGPYLNLLPTSTAKEEIAKTVGHDRIRYLEPKDVVTQEFRPDRLTARLGVDGRIKEFACG
jgi:hypothetical protein